MITGAQWLCYDHGGKLISKENVSLSEACRLTFDHPEKLIIFIETYAVPLTSVSLHDLVFAARFILTGGNAFFISSHCTENKSWVFKDSVQCEVVDREFAKELIRKANLLKPKTDPFLNISGKDTITCKNDDSVVI